MNEEDTRFLLALDCGEASEEELALPYQQIPAYRRARSVWQAIYNQVMGRGGYISTRTIANHGHFYTAVYGEVVPRPIQLQIFAILDRFRQQWQACGASFVQLSETTIQELYKIRRENQKEGVPVGYSISAHDVGALYETHRPRVQHQEACPPMPIDPPFPSTPLYREKQPQDLKARRSRPFLERYYLLRRLSGERMANELAQNGASFRELRLQQVVDAALLLAADRAKKYRFADSAMAMLDALMKGQSGTVIKTLPEHGIFIEFASSLDLGISARISGLFFVSPVAAYQVYEKHKGMRPGVLPSSEGTRPIWILAVLQEDGDILLQLVYHSERRAWKVPEMRQCPENACQQIMSVEEQVQTSAFTIWQLCPSCQKIMDFFARFFPIALLAIAGEFADEAEPQSRQVVEVITRKEKRPDSKKYQERREEVQWRLVTFDASVKRRPAPVETEREKGADISGGPSWLDLAIEQGTIVYVRRGFGTSTRHLDPARNSRWKYKRDIKVKGYEKRVPMTVANLQRVITKVVASKFESGQGS